MKDPALTAHLGEVLLEVERLDYEIGEATRIPPLVAARLLCDLDRICSRLSKHRRAVEGAKASGSTPRAKEPR